MEDHFKQMLGLAPSQGKLSNASFLPSKFFSGRKPGYIFTTRAQGTGYYYDESLSERLVPTINAAQSFRKRGRDDLEDNVDDEEAATGEQKKKVDIEKVLKEADEVDIAPLDAVSLKQLLITLEKKIVRNQQMRVKFYDNPEKFMESELELHSAINDLYVLAASPELYSIVVEDSSGLPLLLGLIPHENTSISLAVVGLLEEMLDSESLEDLEDEYGPFVDLFIESQGLELLVQNLSRLDERNEEDATGFHNTMSVIENLMELCPDLTSVLCVKTNILKYLLTRLSKRAPFDANKLYCSEILSILMQGDSDNQRKLLSVEGSDGMDCLLQAVAQYRKKEPASMDEQECIQNLFLSLCGVLLTPAHQDAFRHREGFELMTRCIAEQKYAAFGAVKTISFAVSGNQENCAKLVEVGGLRYVFPVFMGRGLPRKSLASVAGEVVGSKKVRRKDVEKDLREAEEATLSTISQLCFHATEIGGDFPARLLLKLTENEFEKMDRSAEWFSALARQLQSVDRDIERFARDLNRRDNAEDLLEDLLSDENVYLRRIQGGLFLLQQLSAIIAFVAVHASQGNKVCLEAMEKVCVKLSSNGDYSLEDVWNVLLEQAQSLDREAGGTATIENVDDDGERHPTTLSSEQLEARRKADLLYGWLDQVAISKEEPQ